MTSQEDVFNSASAVRHDWYQTETHVIIVILHKNIKSEQLRIDCTPKQITIELDDTRRAVFNLSHDVCPTTMTSKLTASKLEIKLPKVDGIQWRKLEGDGSIIAKPIPKGPTETSQSIQSKNWDAVVKDEVVDDVDPLNALFRKIYTDGSDEIRKAMNKSFMESGGTVLSTDWNQVKTDKVEIKPPEGTEFKKWE